MAPRCALGCLPTPGVPLHVFPQPEKFLEQFKTWVSIIGGKLESAADYKYYRTLRLCDIHFIDMHKTRNNRLSAIAIPTLFLPGCSAITTPSDQDLHPVLSQAGSAPTVPLPMDISLLPGCSSNTTVTDQDLHTARTLEESSQSVPLLVDIPSTSQSAAYTTAKDQTMCTVLSLEGVSPSVPILNAMPSTSWFSTELIYNEHNYFKKSKNATIISRKKANKFSRKNIPAVFFDKMEKSKTEVKSLRRKIQKLQKKNISFKARLDSAEHLTNEAAFQKLTQKITTQGKIFTHMQLQSAKKPSGRRYSIKEKVLSLSLYKRSPKCYALLYKLFTLPSTKSLKRLLSQIVLQPGINNIVFEKLKKSVKNLNIDDRLCSLIFDEMSVTPQVHYDVHNDVLKGFTNVGKTQLANHALVFMVKGLRKNFKQPVAYYFTNSLKTADLKKLIQKVIINVQAAGLTVLCTVCDQGTTNVSAINELINDSKSDYFKKGKEWRHEIFKINNKTIIPLYDVPHLLKGMRNNLLTKNLVYTDFEDGEKEKTIKWEYLEKLYAADKSYGELRLLPKITEDHINKDKIKKMRVKTAAQIFSHTVAAATEHLTARGNLPEECRQLIPFFLLMDNLFDSLNCNSFFIPDGKIYKACVKRFSPHHELWLKSKKVLKTVKFIVKKKVDDKFRLSETVVPSVKNFVKTIEGMQLLWNELSRKYSFDSFFTRNCNQDPIENFFGNIRSCGARNVSPNCIGFEGAYKSLLLNNFNSPHSINSNCEDDTNTCLNTLDFFLKEKFVNVPEEIEQTRNEDNIIFENISSFRVIGDSGQKQYVCGWVLKKCLTKIVKSCKTCRSDLLGNGDKNSFISIKEYSRNKRWLCYPSLTIDKYFGELQNITVTYLKNNIAVNKTKESIKILCDVFAEEAPFTCPTHKKNLKSEFDNITINILIYSWCRSINRILSGKISYDGKDDLVKVMAFDYFNKHKHFKK